MPYRSLNPEKIVGTLAKLRERIEERFAGRGIVSVCGELLEIARDDAGRAKSMGQPRHGLRLLVATILAIAAAWLVYALLTYSALDMDSEAFHVFQGIEAAINIAILAGAGIWFLLNLEARIKRERILEDLHELRSIAHVIDMHQLTKDPTAILNPGGRTKSSPVRDMSAFELSRYLDYCAEMLSLTGKLAALYLGASRDPIVIHAVNEIEELTTNLSRKIWQKIMMIPDEPAEASSPASPQSGPQSGAGGAQPAGGSEAVRTPAAMTAVRGIASAANGAMASSANDTCSEFHPFALPVRPRQDDLRR